MQSNKFIKNAKKIAKEKKELFDSLIEFEKTGKVRTKERLNFTIDKSTASRFRKYCRDNGYNMSALVDKTIRQILESKKKT